ncbi:hypothetical protein ANN_17937 [Periplaneta americana]|uniref:Uncharacterized protein n=1 Tax=Periplaneta americana TaxID=6978 RepID=A0ABQ8SME0_PERAM|nr:hypothetical protein ANN_17937 [Periplaneta americana]
MLACRSGGPGKKSWIVEEEVFCLATNGSSRRIDIIAYSQTTKKGYIIDPTIRIETGSSQPEDVSKEKINIYLPTVDYFKAKYQLEDIEVIGLLIGARGVIPKFFESFRKTFELPQTLTADVITSVLKRSCQILNIDLDDPETEKAATKIQAVFRGHRSRQTMKSGDAKETVQDLEAEFNPNDQVSEKARARKPVLCTGVRLECASATASAAEGLSSSAVDRSWRDLSSSAVDRSWRDPSSSTVNCL